MQKVRVIEKKLELEWEGDGKFYDIARQKARERDIERMRNRAENAKRVK